LKCLYIFQSHDLFSKKYRPEKNLLPHKAAYIIEFKL
jgi:hypothetical protein